MRSWGLVSLRYLFIYIFIPDRQLRFLILSPFTGFRRKEFRGKLAIAITANFINRNTTAEAKVEEISGVAFIFNQKFFQDLREATGLGQLRLEYLQTASQQTLRPRLCSLKRPN